MGRPWCREWRTGRRRPPPLPLPLTSPSLLVCCGILIIAATGVVGDFSPEICGTNPCQNGGICYEMLSSITNAVYLSDGLRGSVSRPNSVGEGSAASPKLSTTGGATTTVRSIGEGYRPKAAEEASSTSSRPAHTSSTKTKYLSTSSITANSPTGAATTTTTIASTTRVTSAAAAAAISAAAITASPPTPGASSRTAPASHPSRAGPKPSPPPSTPSELQYTVGVYQPEQEAPLTLCPPPFLLIRGLCLYLSDSRQGAEDSRRLCRSLGGRLADVGDEESLLLTRLVWPPPPPRGLYAWVDGTVGQVGRRRQRRTLIGRRLCTAATAATGQLALRHCEEPHRGLCERQPLSTAPHRPRRSPRSPPSSAPSPMSLPEEETCHCEEGYGGDDCVKALENDGHEFEYCQDTRIGGASGKAIIVDFGAMGRFPWETSRPPVNCPSPDVPLPADSDGCVVPSSEAILRYWCQGKKECTPSIDLLSAYFTDACHFDVDGGLDVSMRLYLRYRDDSQTSDVSFCRYGGTYDRDTRTCYGVTGSEGDFEHQVTTCRDMGGDIIYSLDSADYPGYLSLLKKLAADAGLSSDEDIWRMGSAEEPRPVVDMNHMPSEPYPCLSLKTGSEKTCGVGKEQQLYTVCALPPWPGQPAPQCPPVRFDDYGLTFPETPGGKNVTQPCGAGYTGSASYMCGVDGQWSSQYPDLSGCRSDNINTDDAKKRLDKGTEPVSDIVSDLATNVTRQTSQNKPLTSGDVINSVQLLPQMVSAQQAQLSGQADQQTVAKQYLGSITSLVGGLTSGETSWHGMSETERFDTSTVLQRNVEQSAYLLASYLDNQHEDFSESTIRLRTGRYSSLKGNLEYRTQQGSTVTLPDEVGRFNDSGSTTIVFVEYGNLDCLLGAEKCSTPDELRQRTDLQYERFVNSPVVSASVGNTSVTFENSNITLTFKTRLSAASFNVSNYLCAYWNEKTEQWADDGCSLGRITNESVECLCNHLTSFATLMDINGVIEEGSALDLALSWLTTIGCVISLISLAICLLVFTVIPTLRSERTSVHRNLCFCLFTAEFILLAGLQPHGNPTGCAIVAGLLHFFFLAAFAWMCIEGVQIYLMVYKVFASRKSHMRYFYACGYGIPALIVTISVSVTKGEGYGSETACWLSTDNGLIWAFAGPLLFVVLVNICALVMALRVTARAPKGRSTKAPPQASTWIRGSASLVAILGTTWLFGFLYFTNGLLAFSVIFTILNSLQGFFIFLFHVWLNDKNRTEAQRFVWKTTNRMGLTEHDLTTTSAAHTSRAHGGHTVETSVAAPAVSPRPNGTNGTNGTSNDTNQTPKKAGGAGNLVTRALRRVNGQRIGESINGEAPSPTAESRRPLQHIAGGQANTGGDAA
ncbi:adhesion G protein-coupled receptor L2-like [Amphibalanus amphitrite]|uniref:adhesion G protein-coupled receptor L2-like n=1 Tax=Amphibalanus amphitrite TaxID=1232801 RepID=UPI001C91A3E4|nr:adhesion G protein-coupled receptor L2-like [Amphibalanus amphitrite]